MPAAIAWHAPTRSTTPGVGGSRGGLRQPDPPSPGNRPSGRAPHRYDPGHAPGSFQFPARGCPQGSAGRFHRLRVHFAGLPLRSPDRRLLRGRHSGAAELCDLSLGFDNAAFHHLRRGVRGRSPRRLRRLDRPYRNLRRRAPRTRPPRRTSPRPAPRAPSRRRRLLGPTPAEVAAASYPQGPATFDSTDTQKDPATGAAVVCQYLVTFGTNPSIVGVVVSLMDDTEYGTRTEASLLAPPEAVAGVGSEAFLAAARARPVRGLGERGPRGVSSSGRSRRRRRSRSRPSRPGATSCRPHGRPARSGRCRRTSPSGTVEVAAQLGRCRQPARSSSVMHRRAWC